MLPKIDTILEGGLTKLKPSEFFVDRQRRDINELSLFISHFDYLPNTIQEVQIDCKKAHQWFISEYEHKIKCCYFNKRYFAQSKEAEYDDIFYFINQDLIVDFDHHQSIVRFLFRKTEYEWVDSLIKEIKRFKKRRKRSQPELMILVLSSSGIDTLSQPINRQRVNIKENYNDDFYPIHETITRRLNRKNDKGIVLLHGKPGTGKTSYIRHLISSVKKDVIFLPPNMASSITNPDLIAILLENPNSIFVIEDAEKIIVDRKKNGDSPVSAILNISDGLLSDCLNIQIICSFNTDLSKIDDALMRKGRLIARYEFKKLNKAKAKKLSEKLGFRYEINESMTLTAIYNQGENSYKPQINTKPIGFKPINLTT